MSVTAQAGRHTPPTGTHVLVERAGRDRCGPEKTSRSTGKTIKTAREPVPVQPAETTKTPAMKTRGIKCAEWLKVGCCWCRDWLASWWRVAWRGARPATCCSMKCFSRRLLGHFANARGQSSRQERCRADATSSLAKPTQLRKKQCER